MLKAIQIAPWRWGIVCVLLMSSGWSVFLLWLAMRGHEPSGPLFIPVPREHYYRMQALLVFPTYFLMWGVATGVARAWVQRTGEFCTIRQVAALVALAMAGGSILFWLVPDVLVVLLYGFEQLPAFMPYYVPLSVLATIGTLAYGLRHACQLSRGRAATAACVACVLHWAVGMPVLR